MKKILLAVAMMSLAPAAYAQSYVEGNAKDAMCEWHYKDKGGAGKCYIDAMGVISGGDSTFIVSVDGMSISLLETADGKKTVKIGNWKGTYTDKFKMLGEFIAQSDITLSNGYKLKVVY